MPSFDLNDKQNSNAGERDATHRLGSLPVPAVPRDVKVSCNRPKYPEAICWKGPTFFDPTQQNPTPDPMTNQTDDSSTTYPSDIQNSSIDESSHGITRISIDESSDDTDESPNDASYLFVNNSLKGVSHPFVNSPSKGALYFPADNSSDDTSSSPSAMDFSHPSVNESSDGASHPPADKSQSDSSSLSGDREFSIRYVDDIIIECGDKIPYDKNSKSQIATHIATIRAMETPISESIYAPPKFETNIHTKRLGKKAAWTSIPQHSFLGLRYTTYEPSSNTFRRKRAVVGYFGDNKHSDLADDSGTCQTIGTQSNISYDKLIEVIKSIPKYLSDNPKFKMIRGRFKKANNCNSFVYAMAKKADLDDIAELHHTISPGDAAENILDYMSQDGSDLSRVRVEFDGMKSKLMKRPVFVQEKGVISLGLNNNEFFTEACQIMGKHSKRHLNNLDIPRALQTTNLAINTINDILKQLSGLDNKDEMVAHVQALFPLLTTIDSNILQAVKLASGKHKMLQVYLMGILDFFHTVRNELLGLSSDSNSSEFFAPEQKDALDSETPHPFEHRPSVQTASYFRSLLDDASFKNYIKDLLELSQKDADYHDKLADLTFTKNAEQLRNAGKYREENCGILAEKILDQQYVEPIIKNKKTQVSFLNNIILGKYESDFTTLMKSLKNRNPEQPIDATDIYYKILKLYQTALNDEQNQRSLANYMDLYKSITHISSTSLAVYHIVEELQYNLKLTLLNAGVTAQQELRKMFSYEKDISTGQYEDFLRKDLDTVEADVQNELDMEECSDGGAERFNRRNEYISLLARNAQNIFYSMIYHAIKEEKHKNIK